MDTSVTQTDPTQPLRLAPGLRAVERDGVLHIEPSGERKDRTVAFRLTSSQYLELQAFIESFPERQATTALRWLLDHETVRGVMADRMRSQTRRRR